MSTSNLWSDAVQRTHNTATADQSLPLSLAVNWDHQCRTIRQFNFRLNTPMMIQLHHKRDTVEICSLLVKLSHTTTLSLTIGNVFNTKKKKPWISGIYAVGNARCIGRHKIVYVTNSFDRFAMWISYEMQSPKHVPAWTRNNEKNNF